MHILEYPPPHLNKGYDNTSPTLESGYDMGKSLVQNTGSIHVSEIPLQLGNDRNLPSLWTQGMPPQPCVIQSANQQLKLHRRCRRRRVSCALCNREPGVPEKYWPTLTSSRFCTEFDGAQSKPGSGRVDLGLVCLLGGRDPPTGWSGLFKKEKKVTETKKKTTAIQTNQKCQECKLCQPNK